METVIKGIKWETLFQDAPERPEQSFRQKEDDFEHLIPLEFGLNFKKGGIVLPPGLIAGSKLGFVLDTTMLAVLGRRTSTSFASRSERSRPTSRPASPT